ncbi:MAG: Maf family protein [Acidobacteriota bacterium]
MNETPTAGRPRLVLASGSPRRRELLNALGIDFERRPADIDETPLPDEDPAVYVLRLAREKAARVAHAGELVLAADTTVVLDGAILGKPADGAEASGMLARLAGREHVVLSGVALYQSEPSRETAAVETTRVRMAAMTAAEIDWYVATGEPMDKAGAYGIQGFGALFVEQVFGNYTNVVGLPLPLMRRLFAQIGQPLEGYSRPGRG